MLPWYKQLGFSENPLDARPNPELIGLKEQEEKLKNFILKEELCFLNGLTGAGKTSLLKKVQRNLPDHTFLYLDADALPADFNLTEALRGKRNFLDKLRLREMPTKKPVLIVDEFQATDPRLVLEARSRWENPNERQIKSIVIAQISEQLKNVPGSFKDRLGNRVIRLNPLDNESMKNVLEKRLVNSNTGMNYYQRLSPQAIDFLVAVADGNVRRLLEFTDMVFDFHWQRFKDNNPIAQKAEYKVTYPAAKQILTVNNIPVEGYVSEVTKNVKEIKTKKTEKKNEKAERGKAEIKEEEAKQEPLFASPPLLETLPKENAESPAELIEKKKDEPLEKKIDIEKEPVRVAHTFDKEFTLAEQNVLRALLRHEQMTLKQIATDIHLEINKCNGVIANLKKKNAIVNTTTKTSNGEKEWQLTESAKRALVTK